MSVINKNSTLKTSGIVDRIVKKGRRKFRGTLEERTQRGRKSKSAVKKLIAGEKSLIVFWKRSAIERKAHLQAISTGCPASATSAAYIEIDWDKLMSPLEKATTLEEAYEAFLTFHDVVDESLALALDIHEIWEEFAVSEEKKLIEERRKRQRKECRRFPYGAMALCYEYSLEEK